MPYVVKDWLAEHVEVPADLTAADLAAALVKVGLEEEGIHGSGVTGPLVVGEVVSRVPEEQKNGKTINWCQVDVGAHNVLDEAGNPTVPRGIVCGAQNFVEGDRVVVALPGAELPGGFQIASRKTYGHVSDGMICSARELGLGEDHSGIIVLADYLAQQGLLGADGAPAPGTDALALLGLDDEVLEINVTPDRGYCFSVRGVAREYSHSTGAAFIDRGLAENLAAPLPAPTVDGFAVEVDDAAPIHGVVGADRFVTRVVRGVDPSAPTPSWMADRLEKSGMRSISLAVDVTNYVMLELGQPLHAYDLDKVAAPIVVRRAASGERLTTLDEVDRTLDPGDLLITDSPAGARGSRVLGIAGVMGGASSEVTEDTSDVLIEAAHFDAVSIARSARRHKLPSEAAKRFERGVDPLLAPVAAQRVVDLLVEHGGGTADGAVSDLDAVVAPAPIALAVGEAERLVGVAYPREQVVGVLAQVGCVVTSGSPDDGAAEVLSVVAPSWRPDLTGAAELVEEIARIVGYDQIVPVLPPAPPGRGLTTAQRHRRSVARTLAEHGLVETLSYPFVGTAELDELGIPADDLRRRAVRLRNPLSEAQPFLRTSLLVTLLATARRNVARGNQDVAVFELGLVTLPVDGAPVAPALPGGVRPSDGQLAALHAAVPPQPRQVAGVLTGQRELSGWWGAGRQADWTDALDLAQTVAASVGVELTVDPERDLAPWHPGRTARLSVAGTTVGHAGELHPKVLEQINLPVRSVAFELDLDVLVAAAGDEPVAAVPVSTFPVGKEDIALVVDESVAVEDVLAAIRRGAGDLLESVRLFDVFRGEQLGGGKKSLAFSLRLRAADRTLTAEDAAGVRKAVVAKAAKAVGATLRA